MTKTQSEPSCERWKQKIKSFYVNNAEQANCAREFKLSAQFGTSMSAQINLEDAGASKGPTVRRLKIYTSWVKYVVRQYGFYLLEAVE